MPTSSSVSAKPRLSVRQLALCSLFAALAAAGAFIRVPLPILPFSLQTLFVILAGMLLGRRLGPLSIGVYVLVGLLGVPIFTAGGGISYVLHPSFGFLLGFIAGAWLTGFLVERQEKLSGDPLGFGSCFLAGLGGTAVIYLIGVPYFYLIMNDYLNSPMGIAATLVNCFLLTLPGDLLKLILAAWVTKRLRPQLGFIN